MNQHSSPEELGRYLSLLLQFVEGSINVAEFERAYLGLLKSDPAIRSEQVFNVLDTLFAEVDAYSPFPGDGAIDESELRQRAMAAYRALRACTERPIDR